MLRPCRYNSRDAAGFAHGPAGSVGASQRDRQLGATLGREFSYELLQAVSPLDEETLQQG